MTTKRESGLMSYSQARKHLGINKFNGRQSRMCDTVREDEECDFNEPGYRRERDDFDRRYVAYLFIDGTTDVRPLKGRVDGYLVKKSAICDSKRDAQERVAEWLEAK